MEKVKNHLTAFEAREISCGVQREKAKVKHERIEKKVAEVLEKFYDLVRKEASKGLHGVLFQFKIDPTWQNIGKEVCNMVEKELVKDGYSVTLVYARVKLACEIEW